MKQVFVLAIVCCLAIFFTSAICVSQDKAKPAKKEAAPPIPKMTNVTKAAGLEAAKGGHFSWGDYNNDGYPDLLINGHTLLKNSGKPDFKFTDVTKEVGLEKAANNGVWGDYNNDGWLDFATRNGQLWKNVNGKFTEVSKEAKFTMVGNVRSIAWGDYDGDGFIDIYVGVGEARDARKRFIFQPDQLLHNKGDGTFEDVSAKFGINKPKAYGRSVIWCDYDNDGRQDIYVGNYRLKPNFLWHNNKDNTFTDATRGGLVQNVDAESPAMKAGVKNGDILYYL